MQYTMRKTICMAGISAAVAAAAFGTAGCSTQVPDTIKVQNADSSSNLITVTGQEEVKIVPDMTEIEYAVCTQAVSAAECQTKNNEDLTKAIETLKELGVEEKSIQTSSYGLNPIYNWNSGNQEITGYEMSTWITVSDIPIADAGSILSKSVESGVNRIESVSYFCSNYDEAYEEALKGAVAMAKAKAQALAEAEGKTIAGVSSIEEYGYFPNTRYNGYNGSGSVRSAAKEEFAAADLAVMPGEISIEAQVTVSYEMQ